MSCLKITARNLTGTTALAVGGPTVDLDVPGGDGLRMTKVAEQLTTANMLKVEGVLRFDLDYTPTNNAVFIEYYTPMTVDRQHDWIEVSVIQDGSTLDFTRLFVVGKDETRRKWVVELDRGADHWIDKAKAKAINEIEYGYFYLTKDNIALSWANNVYGGDYTVDNGVSGVSVNPAYYWPLVDYGGWVDQIPPYPIDDSPRKMVAIEDLRPFVNLTYLLKKGFCEIGWQLDGLILETDFIKSLWCYLLKSDYYVGNAPVAQDSYKYGRAGRVALRQLAGDYTLSFSQAPILCDTVDFSLSPGSLQYQGLTKWLLGIENPFPFTAKFKFYAQFTVDNNNSIDTQMGFVVGEVEGAQNDDFTGEYLSDFQYFDLTAGSTNDVYMEFDVVLAPGQKGCILHDAALGTGDKFLKGMWFRSEQDNQCLSRFDHIDFQSILRSDVTLLDVFKAFMHIIQGRYVQDHINKVITVYSKKTTDVHGTNVAGFINQSGIDVDLNDRMVEDSVIIEYIRRKLPRYTRLQWAGTTDPAIEDLNLSEPLHSRKVTNGVDLPDDVDEIENPLFEPTIEGQPRDTYLRVIGRSPYPYLPRLWDNTDDERSFDIGPRILFAFGKVKQINPEPFDLSLQGGEHAAVIYEGYTNPADALTEFGYATQLRTWDLTPTPTIDGSTAFGTAANDLYVLFWLGLTQENRGGAILDALVVMDQSFYKGITFRDIYTFRYQGRPVSAVMTEISDHAGCDDTPTQVKFFAEGVNTECCDGPCSCRYSTCDYYMDFGPYMQQSTMDQLTVKSFIVNGVELIDTPVGFGMIEIVDRGGLPYVMNMVDTLNSIGAPYFFFKPSLRVHPDKGMRYFSLKRPICHTFTIEIQLIGTVVYRYTDKIQETNYFGGGFGDFGYNATFHGTPIDCETTTEY